MEKLSRDKILKENRKVFFKKSMNPERLGKIIYTGKKESEYSVYVIRKFELARDDESFGQMDTLSSDLPAQFNNMFTECVVKNLFIRTTKNAAYITFLLALDQPLNKVQIQKIREWLDQLELPKPTPDASTNSIEKHVSPIIDGTLEDEHFLLKKTVDQLGETLAALTNEFYQIKNKRTAPVLKNGSSIIIKTNKKKEDTRKQLFELTKQVKTIAEDFQQLDKKVVEKVNERSKPKKPLRFKMAKTLTDTNYSLENKSNQTTTAIDLLTKRLQKTDEKVERIYKKLANDKQAKPKVSFSKAKQTNQIQNKLVNDMATLEKQVKKITKLKNKDDNEWYDMKHCMEAQREKIDVLEKNQEKFYETSELVKTRSQWLEELSKKVDSIEQKIKKETKKNVPVYKLTKSGALTKMIAERLRTHDQLEANAKQIEHLTQVVGKTESQLNEAYKKITTLEKQMIQQSTEPIGEDMTSASIQFSKNSLVNESNEKSTHNELTKKEHASTFKYEVFIREEKNDAIDIKKDQTSTTSKKDTPESKKDNQIIQPNPVGKITSQMKDIEKTIVSIFKDSQGNSHKSMLSKDKFYANISSIEVIPFQWFSVNESYKKDIMLDNTLSCQELVDALPDFLEQIDDLAQKRKLMGKWVYASKEVEQKVEGYKMLSKYFEYYLSTINGSI